MDLKNVLKFNNLSEMNKKLIKYSIIAVATLILLFIIIGIVNLIKGNKLSFEKIEIKMTKAAQTYYENNPDLLPDKDISKMVLDTKVLEEKGYMKELSKYTNKDVSCSGKIIVLKNQSYTSYIPKLDCQDKYQTKSLVSKLTDKSNIVVEKDGLYEQNGEYVYRGEKINNFATFAGKKWRILRVTKENEIRLIQYDSYEQTVWDDRYNENEKQTVGYNNFNVSRIKDTLEKIYKSKDFKAESKGLIIPKQLCIGAKDENDKLQDGSIECATKTAEYFSLGMLQANEYLNASIDKNCITMTSDSCINYNYIYNIPDSFWSITPDKYNTTNVYYIANLPYSTRANSKNYLKLVVNISGDINYKSGTGTEENPYVID